MNGAALGVIINVPKGKVWLNATVSRIASSVTNSTAWLIKIAFAYISNVTSGTSRMHETALGNIANVSRGTILFERDGPYKCHRRREWHDLDE